MTTSIRPADTQERQAVVAAAALKLAAAWSSLHLAQLALLRLLETQQMERTVGSNLRLKTATQQFLNAVGAFDREARAVVERWSAQDIPLAYRDGALNALIRASFGTSRVSRFSWTAQHQGAVTALSAQVYADLINRIAEAVRRAQAFVRAAQDQARTTAGIDREQLLEEHPLDTVVYRNQARHPVTSWATGALGVQATAAANAAAINYGVWDLDAQWFQCTDGDECGFAGHQDSDHADGTIRSAEDASTWPVSHYGCIREWTPRPDLNNAPNLESGAQA